MFLDLIEKIREKPKSYRNSVSVALSLFLTVIIFTVWVVNVFPNQNSGAVVAGDSSQVAAVEISSKSKLTDKGPIENFTEIFSGAFSDIKNKAGEVKNSIESVLVPFVNGIDLSEIDLPGGSIFEDRIEIDNSSQ